MTSPPPGRQHAPPHLPPLSLDRHAATRPAGRAGLSGFDLAPCGRRDASVQGRPASAAAWPFLSTPKHSAGPVRAGIQARRHPSCWSRAAPTRVHGVQLRIAVNELSSARSACSRLVSPRLRRTNARGVQQLAGAVGGEWILGSAGGRRQRDHHSAGGSSVGEARSLGLPTPPPPPKGGKCHPTAQQATLV